MGLPAWAYGEQASLSEWEDRGAYLYNRKTGEKRPKGAAGGITGLPTQKEIEDNNILSKPILVRDQIEQAERAEGPKESFADRLRRHGDRDRSNIEDRRGERPRVPAETGSGSAPPPEGWPHGWDRTYDPRWIDPRTPPGRLRADLPPDVRQGLAESEEWFRLREEREGDPEEGYEATKSPLVLRKRNPNGTVTYVHAMTGQPLFDLGEYGLNDPQADDSITGKTYPDPYWRAGRREW